MGIANIEAVFLAVDPALHTSGAAILLPDTGNINESYPFKGDYSLYEFGKVLTQGERERYVETLIELAGDLNLPPVIVAETWAPPVDRRIRLPNGEVAYARDPKWTYDTILGIGEGWGRWSAEIEAANEFLREEDQTEIFLARVLPNDWRDKIFGPHRAKDTETLKASACAYFEGVFGYAVSDDIAEAGLIGLYGLNDASVVEHVTTWHADRLAKAAKKKNAKKRKK